MNKLQSSLVKNITLVIPCNHTLQDLLDVLKAVLKGTCLPKEILVVKSGVKGSAENRILFTRLIIDHANELQMPKELSIKSCDLPLAYPGNARNIGVMNSSCGLVAFLDVKTIPSEEWLEGAWNILVDPKYDGVWGVRSYEANTLSGGLIRDAIYGRRPVRSLSGTVFRKEIFNVTGNMISWAPAGEDGDWINRVEAHKLAFVTNGEVNNIYWGLDHKPFSFFIKKWWRYYHYSRLLPVNYRDRFLSYSLFYIALIFFAFNWNFKISVALLGSPLIIPHITTSLVLIGPALYILIRGVYLPLRRGTPLLQVFPVRFLLMLLVAVTLDLVKLFALLTPTVFSGLAQAKVTKSNIQR